MDMIVFKWINDLFLHLVVAHHVKEAFKALSKHIHVNFKFQLNLSVKFN